MPELHIHLHLDLELLDSAGGAIHIHLKPESKGARPQAAELSGAFGQTGAHRMSAYAPVIRSGYAAEFASGFTAAKQVVSGMSAEYQSGIAKQALRDEQRIRSRIYRASFVPPTEDADARAYYDQTQSSELADGLMLELASGNQCDPIVWDSFRPQRQRGMWRFTVREEFGRMIGMVTNATDLAGIWILSEWTPKADYSHRQTSCP
jgi:hypothetical protein